MKLEKKFSRFGDLHKQALQLIAQHKKNQSGRYTASNVADDISNLCGGKPIPGTIVSYGRGISEPDPRMLECVADLLIQCNYPEKVDRSWIEGYLKAGHYVYPEKLLAKLGVNAPSKFSKFIPDHDCTHFVGREEDCEGIVQRIKDNDRIVLLHGLSGIGKTNLAIAVAKQSLPDFDVVVWVSDRHQNGKVNLDYLFNQIVEGLDYPDLVGQPLKMKQQVIESSLRKTKILVVIDNYETIRPEQEQELAHWLTFKLATSPSCRTVITSRRDSRNLRNRCWAIPLTGLKIEFARELMHELLANRLQVEQILLDDISQTVGGNPQVIRSAMGKLTRGYSDAQSLVNMLKAGKDDEWFTNFYADMWDRINGEVRTLVMAACLFPKSANRAALETVAKLNGKFQESLEEALDLSLILPSGSSATRYSQHELVRRVALRELNNPRNVSFAFKARECWINYYLKFTERFERDCVWNDHDKLQELDMYQKSEKKNVEAALDWAVEAERHEDVVKLTKNIRYYYYIRGHWSVENSVNLKRAEAAQSVDDIVTVFEALVYHLNIACKQGNLCEANKYIHKLERMYTQADVLQIPETEKIEYRHALALFKLERDRGDDRQEAKSLWQQNLKVMQESKTSPCVGSQCPENRLEFQINANLRWLATCHILLNESVEARKLLDEVVEHSDDHNSTRGSIWAQVKLASVDVKEELFDTALGRLDRLVESARKINDPLIMGDIALLYGEMYLNRDQAEKARMWLNLAADGFDGVAHVKRLGKAQKLLQELDHKSSSL